MLDLYVQNQFMKCVSYVRQKIMIPTSVSTLVQLTSLTKYLPIQNETILDHLYDPEVGYKWLPDTQHQQTDGFRL